MNNKLLFITILLLSIILTPVAAMASAKKAVADGSFLQSSLCGNWTNARWQKEFSAMKDAGMHYLIIGPVAESSNGKITKTLYPSSLPNTEAAQGRNGIPFPDVVDACLRNAESAGIKVFIGIGMNDKWWSAPGGIDSTWMYNQMNFDNKVCDELWNLYKKMYPNAFYGWYWAYEVANINLTIAQQKILTNAMNMQLDHLIAKNEKLPFMWCPFMNSSLGTPQAYQTMWENVLSGLHTTSGDIFCPQDCVGAGGLKLNQVDSWFSALRQAVNTKPGLIMWSDVETFDHHDWSSATMDRIIKQMQIEQPYVDNYITFAYCHYQSPCNTDTGYQATYLDYLKTNSLDRIPPSVPENFTAALNSHGDVELNWNASTDNIGVCGYYVYRNGGMICKKQVPRKDQSVNTIPITSFTDSGLNQNGIYSYRVQAFDFANNLSAYTKQITITSSVKGN